MSNKQPGIAPYLFNEAKSIDPVAITSAELIDIKERINAVSIDASAMLSGPAPNGDLRDVVGLALRANSIADIFDGVTDACRSSGRSGAILDHASQVETAARSLYRTVNTLFLVTLAQRID